MDDCRVSGGGGDNGETAALGGIGSGWRGCEEGFDAESLSLGIVIVVPNDHILLRFISGVIVL